MYESDQSNLEPQPPEESSNRTFLIAAGILGGIVLLSIACLAGYALLILPGQQAANQQNRNASATQNALVAQGLTATFQAITFPTATVTPSQTPVVAQPSATPIPITPTNTQDPATATVAAALTLAAQAQLTHVPTSTALPGTGIGDQYGAPGLVIAGIALIAVIFLARRLRATPEK
jgi:cytochrome bd-type quinol oxidase subunit 2